LAVLAVFAVVSVVAAVTPLAALPTLPALAFTVVAVQETLVAVGHVWSLRERIGRIQNLANMAVCAVNGYME